MNYCLGCHSAKYQRYNRLARDLGISEEDVMENLMFSGEKIGDLPVKNSDSTGVCMPLKVSSHPVVIISQSPGMIFIGRV